MYMHVDPIDKEWDLNVLASSLHFKTILFYFM